MISLDRAVAILLLLALAEHLTILRMAVAPLLGVQSSALLLAIIWLWLLLNGASIAGLALQRRWGAYFVIALVPVSTILLSIPLLPLVTSLVPVAYRAYAMMAVNVTVLLAMLKLLSGSAADPRSAAQAG